MNALSVADQLAVRRGNEAMKIADIFSRHVERRFPRAGRLSQEAEIIGLLSYWLGKFNSVEDEGAFTAIQSEFKTEMELMDREARF